MYYLAVLPFLFDVIFLTNTFVETSRTYSFRIGAKFSLPFYFPSLTNVYDFPSRRGVSVNLPLFEFAPIFGAASSVVYTVIIAFVSAGYLGKLHSSVRGGSSSFGVSAARYFFRILAFAVLWLALTLVGAIIAVAQLEAGILYFLLILLVGYLVFLTPFVIVADNVSFAEALGRSISASVSLSSKTISFVLLYGLATLVVSVPVYLILNAGLLGFFVALAAFAFVGTVLVASTFYFYSDLALQLTRPLGPRPPESGAVESSLHVCRPCSDHTS